MKVDLFSIGRFTVHTYGVMIAIGVILCVLMGYYRAKRLRDEGRVRAGSGNSLCGDGISGGKSYFFVILSWKQFSC